MAKSLQPLLNMIAQFITTGDFEDPFEEFFVEKLESRINRQQVAFRKCEEEKTPIFLREISETIYRVGCNV